MSKKYIYLFIVILLIWVSGKSVIKKGVELYDAHKLLKEAQNGLREKEDRLEIIQGKSSNIQDINVDEELLENM